MLCVLLTHATPGGREWLHRGLQVQDVWLRVSYCQQQRGHRVGQGQIIGGCGQDQEQRHRKAPQSSPCEAALQHAGGGRHQGVCVCVCVCACTHTCARARVHMGTCVRLAWAHISVRARARTHVHLHRTHVAGVCACLFVVLNVPARHHHFHTGTETRVPSCTCFHAELTTYPFPSPACSRQQSRTHAHMLEHSAHTTPLLSAVKDGIEERTHA